MISATVKKSWSPSSSPHRLAVQHAPIRVLWIRHVGSGNEVRPTGQKVSALPARPLTVRELEVARVTSLRQQ